MRRPANPIFAAALALALAACSEQSVEAQAPTAEEAPAKQDRTDEAIKDLRRGAESIAKGARTLFEEGRDAASRALDDSGPAIERAHELAREFGIAAGEVAERMSARLGEAVEDLNRRIRESDKSIVPDAVEGGVRLGPVEGLRADTLAAARAGPAGVGSPYVGVWTANPEDCARIDRAAVEVFAVITPSTIRRHENICNFEETPMSDGNAILAASCIAEGDFEDRLLLLHMPSDDVLEIGSSEAPDRTRMVRCRLGG